MERHRGRFKDGHAEDGYRIHKGQRWLWLRPQEAYAICCALADLLDADAQEGNA